MKNGHVYALFLMLIFFTSCKGQAKTERPIDTTKSQTKFTSPSLNRLTGNILDVGKGVVIQTSLPKGGPYTDFSGKNFGYTIFWTRVMNETATPLELTVNFPADSFVTSPDSYIKVFLPPDKMTLDKEPLQDYGATGLKFFIGTGLHKPTLLQRTIAPKEECLFYTGMLFYTPNSGPQQAGLVLKGDDLFYEIDLVGQLNSLSIPCGHITIGK